MWGFGAGVCANSLPAAAYSSSTTPPLLRRAFAAAVCVCIFCIGLVSSGLFVYAPGEYGPNNRTESLVAEQEIEGLVSKIFGSCDDSSFVSFGPCLQLQGRWKTDFDAKLSIFGIRSDHLVCYLSVTSGIHGWLLGELKASLRMCIGCSERKSTVS